MINPAYKALGYQQITPGGVATGLAVPAGCSLALITPEVQAVRWRDDGQNPTAAVGYPLAVGAELVYTGAQLSVVRFIDAVAGAIINVSYYG